MQDLDGTCGRARRREGEVLEVLAQDLAILGRTEGEDGLAQLRALARLGPETPLERRATVIADLEETDGAATLVFEGKEIGFPANAVTELRACFESEEPFLVADLPGELDADGRLVLARRLVREGFLRVVTAD